MPLEWTSCLSAAMPLHLKESRRGVGLDRTVVRKTTLKEQDEAFCLALSIDERLKVLEELNRIGRLAAGYPEARLDRSKVRAAI